MQNMSAIGKVYIISNYKNFIEKNIIRWKYKRYIYAQNKKIRRKAGYFLKKQ